MYINSNTIERLKVKTTIGMRIRIIREYLKEKLGNQFSGNSVASRIEGLTQSSLNMIELGKVKSVSAEVLYYLAKDFGVSYEVFFDDFYLQPNPKIKIASSNTEILHEQNDTLIKKGSINPLDENQFKINIKVSKVASNGDYQVVLYRNTREEQDTSRILSIVAQVIHTMNTHDLLVKEEAYESPGGADPLIFAKELINNSVNNSLVFPWYNSNLMTQIENDEYYQAINYTKKLINEKQQKEEAARNE
ncbi:helix-turn-helix domain-containing protein [Niallia alba]|uniref:helix-turn-helix domain-containing protein n=1 Tax=Niallia alba TaxID=2729105 RepID=UPI002E22CD01|nr:helix-turn-helix domain-containing protein [Niallia alba]